MIISQERHYHVPGEFSCRIEQKNTASFGHSNFLDHLLNLLGQALLGTDLTSLEAQRDSRLSSVFPLLLAFSLRLLVG